MNNKIIAIVQARMSSTRLPGKVLKTLLSKPVLKHVIDRILDSKYINQVVVVTTNDPDDDKLVEWCKKNNLECFRGDREDVLKRFYECSKKYKADNIVRITSDNPLVDPEIIDKTIDLFYKENADYCANNIIKTFPHGFDVEVVTFKSLKESHINAKKDFEREHVTQFIRYRPNEFKLCNLSSNKDCHKIRLTLDNETDFQLIELVMLLLGENANLFALQSLFSKFPSLTKINLDAKNWHAEYNNREKII